MDTKDPLIEEDVANTDTVVIRRKRNKNSSVLTTRAIVTSNLGNTTILTSVPMKTFFSMSVVANRENADTEEEIAQRNLNMAHAKKLAVYMMKGILQYAQILRKEEGEQPNATIDDILDAIGRCVYTSVQPFVCNIRGCGQDLKELGYAEQHDASGYPVGSTVRLTNKTMFYLVDGQHRREAMRKVLDFLRTSQSVKRLPKTSLLAPYKITDSVAFSNAMAELLEIAETEPTAQIECHLDLSIEKERQLFSDMNNLSRKVEHSIISTFDASNPICALTNEIRTKEKTNAINLVSLDKAINVTSKVIGNNYKPKPCTPVFVRERANVARDFWDAVTTNKMNNSSDTNMLNSIGVLKALATLLFRYNFAKTADEAISSKLIDLIKTYDFDLETNPLFKVQILSDVELENANLTHVKARLVEHHLGSGDYNTKDVETLAIIENEKARLVKVYCNIFIAILEKQ
jgi:hypothetical protein